MQQARSLDQQLPCAGALGAIEDGDFAIGTLALPATPANATRYSAGIQVLDEINSGKSEVYP